MKNVFLTGASSGIGLAIAKLVVAEGHEVWGTSRNLERIPKLPRLRPVRLDLDDPRSVEAAFNAALAEAGHFDVLINNAGSGHFGPAENLSEREIASQFQILVFGQVQLMRLALRMMQARGEGLIINVTSLAGRLPVPFMAAYNAAKAALASFTMSIQLELAAARIVLRLERHLLAFAQQVSAGGDDPGVGRDARQQRCGGLRVRAQLHRREVQSAGGRVHHPHRRLAAALPPVLMMLAFEIDIQIVKWVMTALGRPVGPIAPPPPPGLLAGPVPGVIYRPDGPGWNVPANGPPTGWPNVATTARACGS